MIEWVRQKDSGGCGAATVAMILGWPYKKARSAIEQAYNAPEPINWDVGVSHFPVDRVLGENGWFGYRRYITWEQQVVALGDEPPVWEFKPDADWPPKPFAEIHYAQVQQPSGRFHFVVMLEDGTVLDPMVKGKFDLTNWPSVANVRGLCRR